MTFVWIVSFVTFGFIPTHRTQQTPQGPFHSGSLEGRSLKFVDDFYGGVADWGDAQHRGEKWYDQGDSSETESDLVSGELSYSSSSVSSSEISMSDSAEASSAETTERRKATESYRTCTPCPADMLKSYKNVGIKWICGGYQRARRSFKSECMMRYRNCQDGTMFVKIYDHRCKEDPYHGNHWFYIYHA